MNNLFEMLNKCDVTYEFDKIYNLLTELIKAGISINEIDNNCPKLTSYRIIDFLIKYGNNTYLNTIKNYYINLKINQNKCLVIADNHMGRLTKNDNISNQYYENERGLYSAYNHALNYNIQNIIHLGDLLEGDSAPAQLKIPVSQQLEYLKHAYPSINGIKTYLLYGNHDYNLIYFNGVNDKFYKMCSNMELIGINYSYINFCNYIIKLSHECKMAEHFQNIDLPHYFELSGHSHSFCMYDKFIQMPSISSASVDQNSIGYIEMINEENEFLFKFFDQFGHEIYQKEKVLKKH